MARIKMTLSGGIVDVEDALDALKREGWNLVDQIPYSAVDDGIDVQVTVSADLPDLLPRVRLLRDLNGSAWRRHDQITSEEAAALIEQHANWHATTPSEMLLLALACARLSDWNIRAGWIREALIDLAPALEEQIRDAFKYSIPIEEDSDG